MRQRRPYNDPDGPALDPGEPVLVRSVGGSLPATFLGWTFSGRARVRLDRRPGYNRTRSLSFDWRQLRTRAGRPLTATSPPTERP